MTGVITMACSHGLVSQSGMVTLPSMSMVMANVGIVRIVAMTSSGTMRWPSSADSAELAAGAASGRLLADRSASDDGGSVLGLEWFRTWSADVSVARGPLRSSGVGGVDDLPSVGDWPRKNLRMPHVAMEATTMATAAMNKSNPIPASCIPSLSYDCSPA